MQETNQLIEGMPSSMGLIEALSRHLHASAWSWPHDLMPPRIHPAAAQTLHLAAADLHDTQQTPGLGPSDTLPASFECLLTMLASSNEWAGGMAQSWLLQLLLVHADIVMDGERL